LLGSLFDLENVCNTSFRGVDEPKLQSVVSQKIIFSVTGITLKNIIFWVMTPCSPIHRRLGKTYNPNPSIIRMIKSRRISWAVNVARMRDKRNAYRIFMGKPEGKRPLGRPERRWEDNIKMDIREIEWGGMD
jgi:hypothetical protein